MSRMELITRLMLANIEKTMSECEKEELFFFK